MVARTRLLWHLHCLNSLAVIRDVKWFIRDVKWFIAITSDHQRIYGRHVFIMKLISARHPTAGCPPTALCPLPQSLFSSQAQFLLSSFIGWSSFVLLSCFWLGWLVLQRFRGRPWSQYFTIKTVFCWGQSMLMPSSNGGVFFSTVAADGRCFLTGYECYFSLSGFDLWALRIVPRFKGRKSISLKHISTVVPLCQVTRFVPSAFCVPNDGFIQMCCVIHTYLQA